MATRQEKILVVDGYLREHEQELKLSNILPTAINYLIFCYQLLVDVWDTKISNPQAVISDDGSTFKIGEMKDSKGQPLFDIDNEGRVCWVSELGQMTGIVGSKVVGFNVDFEWCLTMVEAIGMCPVFVGLVPNKEEALMHASGPFGWGKHGAMICFGTSREVNGVRMHWTRKGLQFEKQDDVLKLRFIWNEHECTLQVVVNGENVGDILTGFDADIYNKESEFRLVVSPFSNIKIMLDSSAY